VRAGQFYKIHQEIPGIILAVHPKTTVMIPEGAVVAIVGCSVDSARMVDVTWNEKSIMIFALELRERGELVHGAASESVRQQ
jgi:hypothetical protein